MCPPPPFADGQPDPADDRQSLTTENVRKRLIAVKQGAAGFDSAAHYATNVDKKPSSRPNELQIKKTFSSAGGDQEKTKKTDNGMPTPGDMLTKIDKFIDDLGNEFGIPQHRRRRAARLLYKTLRGIKLIPGNPALPAVAPAKWNERGTEETRNPIDFLEDYWGEYMDNCTITQCDLKKLDKSIFEAVRIYCRNMKEDPLDYLPMAATTRPPKSHAEIDPGSGSEASRPEPRSSTRGSVTTARPH
jgi:hypothetical protein